MPSRKRLTAFVGLLIVCTVAAVVAVVVAVRGSDQPLAASAGSRTILADARKDRRPMVLFRSLQADGQLALAPASDPSGPRRLGPLRCARVYFAGGRGLCIARGTGLTPFRAEIFGPDLRVRASIGLEGLPSRARVSSDGRYGVVTMFVAGHSYAAAGTFSTATTLIDMATGRKVANLEQFTVTRAGRQVTAVDVNFWGVTFARDSDRFYATLATGGRTYLIQGSVSGRVAHVLHENVECPSLSPDGTHIAFKRRTGSQDRPWRLTVLDLRTMRETPLAETRSVDDQAEWLDHDHVLYGEAGQVWVVPADGSGAPRRYIEGADSPTVVRWAGRSSAT